MSTRVPLVNRLRVLCSCCLKNSDVDEEENESLLQASGDLGKLLLQANEVVTAGEYAKEVSRLLVPLLQTPVSTTDPLQKVLLPAAKRADEIYNTETPHCKVLTTSAVSGSPDSQVILDGDTVFLVLRGTKDVEDVFSDALFVPSDEILGTGGSRLAMGFLGFAQKVLSAFVPYLEKHEEAVAGRKLCITGHSLGGGAAICVLALLVTEQGPRTAVDRIFGEGNVSVLTFGSPLAMIPGTGTDYESFEVNIAKKMTHVVHQLDLVPRLLGDHDLPELEELLGKSETGCALNGIRRQYGPCGRYLCLMSQEGGHVTLGLVEEPSALLACLPHQVFLPHAVADHSMVKYRDHLSTFTMKK